MEICPLSSEKFTRRNSAEIVNGRFIQNAAMSRFVLMNCSGV